jgi:hypothetical protein
MKSHNLSIDRLHCACHRGREYFGGFRHFPPVNYRRKDFKVSKPSETFFNTGFRVLGSPRDSFETAESFEFTISDSFASFRASCALRLPSRPGVLPRLSTLSACKLQAEGLQSVETLGSIFNTGFRVLGSPRDSFETAESSGSTISDSFASIRASCALRLPSRGGGVLPRFSPSN